MASWSLFSKFVFCSILMTWNFTVDGSTKMPNGHMDAIEPYDYRAFQPFSTAYLPGPRPQPDAEFGQQRAFGQHPVGVCRNAAGDGHLHPHHRNRNVRPRQGRQLERLEYRQRRFWRQLGRKILRVSILTTAAAFFVKAAAGLLSEFFVITLRNVLLFRGAATTKKLLQRLIRAAGVFLLFPFQPEHLKLPVSVGLVLVEFLGLDVAFEGTVKLQGVPVLLNVGQHAGNGGFLALKLRFAVP